MSSTAAFIIIDGVDQGFAAVDIQMVCRLIEDQQMWPLKGGKAQKKSGFFTTRQALGGDVHLLCTKTHLSDARARTFASGASGISGRTCSTGFSFGRKLIQLMLSKEGDLELVGPVDGTIIDLQSVRDQFGEGGFTITVGTQQGQAIIRINPQIKVFEDRFARFITDRRPFSSRMMGGAARFSGFGKVIGLI